MADALTSGLKTYGEIRTRIGVGIAVIVSLCMCIFGWMIILGKDVHTVKTSGTLSEVNCTSNVCTATALYDTAGSTSPSPAPYRFQSSWPANSTEGQSVTVYYDPANPASASMGPVPKGMGWGLVGVATLIIIIAILFMTFFSSLSNQGKAVVGGFEAVSDVSSFFKRN
jgi:hypothetical protein